MTRKQQAGRLTGRVFLTGGTGSLGHALLNRADSEQWDCQFTIYSRDEVKQGEMKGQYPRHKFVLGDVRDLEALKLRMRGHDLVIHAGAYKQVPAAEVNVAEAIETNVVGSKNVALAAVRFGIPQVLGISTDKACAPTNAYGASKMLMEKVFQEANSWGHTRFNLVRYGNVLGTRGSVIPLFIRQAQEGRITLTDPYMTRFWLTLRDAVDIVLQGVQEEEGGTVLVPKAPAATMAQLAEAVAPGVPIECIGIRPGEKTHEVLLHAGESMHADADGEWFRIFPAYAGHKGNINPEYEYRSDHQARRLTTKDLRRRIEDSDFVGLAQGDLVEVPA